MKIKIWFTDFWDGFDPYDNFFTKLLSKYHDIEITPSEPELLIFSWVLKDFYNYKNCVRIYFTGENIRPDYSICDYSISFDYDSFDKRNLRLPLYVLYGEKEKLIKLKSVEQIAVEKIKFCNFIYSNERAKERKEFFDILNKYKKVDSGGNVFNNIGYRVDSKLDFIKDYKFTIAFENSSYRGYTTEKIFEPMMVQSIPIYWGNPNVKEDFNVKSFINVHDYGSFKEVVEKIKEIDTNDDLYQQMLREPFLIPDKKNDYFSEQRILTFFNRVFSERKISRLYSNQPTKSDIKISVIVPVYNTSQYIPECLDSIFSQDFNDFEVICINDGSTDDSEKILEQYKKKYNNIKILYEDNQGLSAARNLGIKNSSGKYILFVDSDDKVQPNAFKKVYEKAELMESDILGFNYTDQLGNVRKTKSVEYKNGLLDGSTFYMLYFDANKDFPLSSVCLYLFRKSFIDKYNFRFKHGIYHEDEHFFIRALIKCKKIYYYNEPLYFYRIEREGSIMQGRGLRNAKDLNLVARELYYYLKENGVTNKIFYKKIFQLYLSSALIITSNNKQKLENILEKEDKFVLRSCIQNFTNFYYYSLMAKNIKLFKTNVIDKKPYLVSRIIMWSHKLYYFCFSSYYRMK